MLAEDAQNFRLKYDFTENPLITAERNKSARVQCEHILNAIQQFENTLDDETEIEFCIGSFGREIKMRVETIGYYNPSIVLFNGFIENEKSSLIQNVNQLNFLIVAKKKLKEKANRIGFYSATTVEQEGQ